MAWILPPPLGSCGALDWKTSCNIEFLMCEIHKIIPLSAELL